MPAAAAMMHTSRRASAGGSWRRAGRVCLVWLLCLALAPAARGLVLHDGPALAPAGLAAAGLDGLPHDPHLCGEAPAGQERPHGQPCPFCLAVGAPLLLLPLAIQTPAARVLQPATVHRFAPATPPLARAARAQGCRGPPATA